MIIKMLQLRGVRAISGRIKGVSRRCVSQQSSSVSQGVGDTQGYVPLPTKRTADTAVHSSDPQGEVEDKHRPMIEYETEPPKPPIASSPKINHTEVGLPSKPNTTQKRKAQTEAQPEAQPGSPELACVGLDGSPWPDDEVGQKAQNKAQEEDNKKYFKDHKASPLSEIEFADSRKPITQATDTNTTSGGIILFTDEQRDTAEESLMRAVEIWRWNKIRGDPNSPHGRVLRELRGEFW